MRTLLKISACLCAILLTSWTANAQFHTSGDDPAGLRWKQIETASYRIIYPVGTDSLAMVMARDLETWKKPVGNSSGYIPNQFSKRKLPVVLHTRTANNNGIVTWAPSRMELLTVPDAYKPISQTWDEQLIIHESRHVSQMQLGCDPRYGFFNAVVGQMWSGATAGLYPGPAFMEGDAVVTETALSRSGRGRSADFLEYWRVAFDQGDMRDYWRWVYGSQKLYTTDHYAAGYVLHAGLRSVFDIPDFTARYHARIFARKGLHLRSFNLQKTIKEATGLNLGQAFAVITDTLAATWRREAEGRAPYTPMAQVTADRRRYTSYSGLTLGNGGIFALRKALDRNTELTVTDSCGKTRVLRPFAGMTSSLRSSSDGSIYWSEHTSDTRWDFQSSSRIRCYDGNSIRNLTTKGRFYNPSPSPDALLISAVEYPVEGGSRLVLLDSRSGSVKRQISAPDGMQLVESEWLGDKLYVSAITSSGFGIYRLDGNAFTLLTPTIQAKVNNLRGNSGALLFISDRSGVNEVYSLDPDTGNILQLTSTRNGVDEFAIDPDNGNFYLTVPGRDGRMVFKASSDSLKRSPVEFAKLHCYPFADKLSEQEASFPMTLQEDFEPSEARPYSKLGHLFRFHSWAPVSINYDALSSMSVESVTSDLALGATGFFQNSLGTASGYVTWFANDSYGWRNGASARFTYTGLRPVIELNADINKADAFSQKVWRDSVKVISANKGALVRGSALIYLPLRMSSGGWNRGIIPQIKYNISNDELVEASTLASHPAQMLTASLRAYASLSTPHSAIYPRWGLGLEAGYHARLDFTSYFRPVAYAYAYGYIPGVAPGHGIRMSVMTEKNLGNGRFVEPLLSIAPRGYNSAALRYMCRYDHQTKFSFDYAMPLLSVDWSGLSPVAYLRNFELTAHYDLSLFNSSKANGNLSSIGVDLAAVLGNLLWLPYDTRIGVSYNYNTGASFAELQSNGSAGRNSLSLIFSIKL